MTAELQKNPEKTYFYEDFKIGDKYDSGPYHVTEEEIKEFASKYDPQPFHLDNEAAKNTVFKGLAASGWHTAAMSMNLLVRAIPPIEGGMIGRSIEKLQWYRPVRPGDILRYECEITDMRPSNSKKKLGIIHGESRTYNQKDELVQSLEVVMIAPRKEGD